MLPPGEYFAVNLPLGALVSLNHYDYLVSHHEVRILILIRVAAHAHCPVGQIAEHSAAVFTGNDREAAAACGVAMFRAVKRVGFQLLDGNLEPLLVGIVRFD